MKCARALIKAKQLQVTRAISKRLFRCTPDNAQFCEDPSKLLASGNAKLREKFTLLFREANLRAASLKGVVAGDAIVDYEKVTRSFPEGVGEIELVIICAVREGQS